LLQGDLDVLPDWKAPHRPLLLIDVHVEPGGNRRPARAEVVGHPLLHLRGGAGLHRLAPPDDVGRHRHLATVDLDMPVAPHLPRLAAGGRHAEAEDHVVQPALEELEQVLAGDPLLALRAREVAAELRLQHPVDVLGLLLFPELDAVVGQLGPGQPALAGGVVPPLDRALLAEAARALEKELDPLAPALPADRLSISRPTIRSPTPAPS